jgi:isoleucyl-tRNA synthetase
VPLPIFYCEDGTPVMEKEVFDHISDLFRKYGSNVWFEREAKDLLPEGYTNPHSPNGTFKKEKDVMDVWFDSGSSFNGVLIERGLGYPADLYFEGSDQYRGWFNSSLIVGTATQGQAPYKSVLSHGMVLDGKGNKMSKSLGNTVDPIKVINQYGADILRLWVASVDYQADVRISKEILKGISDNYRKIRNTMRFILGNLNEFKDTDVLPVDELDEIDQYIMIKLNHVLDSYNESMTAYNFADAVKTMTNYITNTLSAFYMDFTKDVLYCDKFNSTRRRQIQSTLYYNAKALMKMLSPILVFTSEELHDHFYCDAKKEDSIFLEAMPETVEVKNAEALEKKFDDFMTLRDDVMRSLEALRNDKVIGSNMEARLTISLKDDYKELASLKNAMKTLFIVARVDLSADHDDSYEEGQTAYIKAEKFGGVQCPRCRNYFNEDELVDGLCPRCHDVVSE